MLDLEHGSHLMLFIVKDADFSMKSYNRPFDFKKGNSCSERNVSLDFYNLKILVKFKSFLFQLNKNKY